MVSSFKRNIAANFVGQFYTTVIGILLVPMYLRYMGTEAYGLVGFFTMLQAWFQLLDIGLTPTLAREAARYRGGSIVAAEFRKLVRALEIFFWIVSACTSLVLLACAGLITTKWLHIEKLPLAEVQRAVALIVTVAGLRLVSSFYRSALSGFEKFVWLSSFGIAISTARFVLVLPFMYFFGATPSSFFGYQLVVAVLEIVVLAFEAYKFIPRAEIGTGFAIYIGALRSVAKFSMTIAFTGIVWVFVTQIDKLLLSSLLPLSQYAQFTLAIMMANGIIIVSGPITIALQPRITMLNAQGNYADFVGSYRNGGQLVAVATAPIALVMAMFPDKVLWAWTTNYEVAQGAAIVLRLYAVGNLLLVLSGFQYALQVAKGDLKLHLIGNILFAAFFVPVLIFMTRSYGMRGAGYAWILANSLSFLVVVPIVHRRFVTGLHRKWMQEIGIIIVPLVTGIFAMKYLLSWPSSRLKIVLMLGGIVATLYLIAAIASPLVREKLRQALKSHLPLRISSKAID